MPERDHETHPTAPEPAPRRPWGRCLLAAVKVTIVGGTLIGIAESGAAAFLTRAFFEDGWPWGLILASAGKAILTHTIIWLPVMAVGSLLYCGIRGKDSTRHPEPFIAGLFVLIAGAVVIPVDLEVAQLGRSAALIVGLAGAMALAAVAYLLLASLVRRIPARSYARISGTATIAAALIALASGWVLFASPLGDPADYRVPSSGSDRANAAAAGRPNVLWIVLDTVRADHMSCYGYERKTTPFLEQWARDALVFDRATANGMWTVPSHASMFTGLSVREHGTDHHNLWLDAAFTTVADALADGGYRTASFSNNPWIARHSNLAQGFETCHVVYQLRRLSRFSLEQLADRYGISPFLPWLDADLGAALANRMIDSWLAARGADDAPAFVFVNFMEGHLPYQVPRRYRAMFMDDAQVERSYDLRYSVYGNIIDALDLRFNIEGPGFLPESDREVLRRQYDACIRYLDDRVKELLDLFDRRGLLDNTLVVIASDHGEYLDTHGMWSHRMQLYQDTIGVCLMIRPPGLPRGARIGDPVLLSDLHRTVLAAALDARADEGATGVNLLDAVDDPRRERLVVSEYGGPSSQTMQIVRRHDNPPANHRAQPQIAVQDRRFKYLATADGTRELYDLVRDPGELHNLIDDKPDAALRLADYAGSWMESVPVYSPSANGQGDVRDPQVLQALRSLGYLGGGEDAAEDGDER